MSTQLTPEDLEKMSPQSLIEFMTENIPPNKLRACLQDVESFPTTLSDQPLDLTAKTEPIEETPVEKTNIESLRNKCNQYPIIVVKIDKMKGKDGDYVYFYKKKGDTFKYIATPVDKFNKENCDDESKFEDTDCQMIEEWIKTKIKDGVLDSTIKSVMQDYVNNNKAQFIDGCESIKKLLQDLGIDFPVRSMEEPKESSEINFTTMNNEEKILYLKQNCVYESGILIGDLLEKEPNKAIVYIPQPDKNTPGAYVWKEFKLKLDDLNDKFCKKIERQIKGSEKYRKYSLAYSNTLPDMQTKIQKVVDKLKAGGIEIPYTFLESGGSSFGTISTLPPSELDDLHSQLNFADVIEYKYLPGTKISALTIK